MTSPRASTVVLPVSKLYLCSCLSLPVYRSAFESGDQTICPFWVSLSESCFICPPCSSQTQTSSRPLLSLTKAIHLPSRDQAGCPSRAPGVRVSRRTSPLSVATVNSSPCVAITARLPDGDRW